MKDGDLSPSTSDGWRNIAITLIDRVGLSDSRLRETLIGMRQVIRLVAILNLAYFGVEFAVAHAIGSVSLFADSVDFLEDASVNLLILVALRWNAPRRARVGMLLASVLLVPSLAALWTAWHKISMPIAPAPVPMSLTGAGAFAVNLSCALLLNRYRDHAGSLTRAAFLSARNDVLANVAIIGAGWSRFTPDRCGLIWLWGLVLR